jgi:hypothetical protein
MVLAYRGEVVDGQMNKMFRDLLAEWRHVGGMTVDA